MSQTVEVKRKITAMQIEETKTAINQGQSKCEMPRKKPSTILDLQIIKIIKLFVFRIIRRNGRGTYIRLHSNGDLQTKLGKMSSLKSKIKTLQSKYDDLYFKNVELNKKMCAVLK